MNIQFHPAIFAKGKQSLKTLSGGNLPTAGDSVFTFTNSGDTIDVGDHVFSQDQDSEQNQYLGKCTVSSGAGITTQIELQSTPLTSFLLWVPVDFAYFQYGLPRTGIVLSEDDGISAQTTRGGNTFVTTFSDPVDDKIIPFSPVQNTEYDLWKTFRRNNLGENISFSFYDQTKAESVVITVVIVNSERSVTMLNRYLVGFTETIRIQFEDTYT